MDFTMGQGDTLAVLKATLKDGAGAAVDVSGGVTTFLMRAPGAAPGVYTRSVACTFDTDGSNGVVKAGFAGTEPAGLYYGQFHYVQTSGSKPLTFPSDRYLEISIAAKL